MQHQFYLNLQRWHEEGRSMPGYNYGFGAAYIAYLLGLYPVPRGPTEYTMHSDLLEQINRQHPQLIEMLEGPHGWAILQMLIVRKAETLANEAKAD